MKTIICSGLIDNSRCCEKRDNCAHYVHWTIDRRSEFNACFSAPFKYFVALTAPASNALPQLELFA